MGPASMGCLLALTHRAGGESALAACLVENLDEITLCFQQRPMFFEQCRVTLLHLLEKRQEVAILLEKALLGRLNKSPGAMRDQGRPIQSQSRQGKFPQGSARVEAAISEQQQVVVARALSRVPQRGISRCGWPVGRLVQVAAPAAVHQVGRRIGSAV